MKTDSPQEGRKGYLSYFRRHQEHCPLSLQFRGIQIRLTEANHGGFDRGLKSQPGSTPQTVGNSVSARSAPPTPAPEKGGSHAGRLDTPRWFFAAALIYFGLQVVLRVSSSPTVELDEAEQLVLTQELGWGYSAQAPLFTWLQRWFFELFGPSVLALSLLKNLLLFGTYAFTYLSVRLSTRAPLAAFAGAASLLFIPQIAWESQRDLTHTVLVTCVAAATVYVLLRLGETRHARDYLALGFCLGLGLLSKYNYAVLAVSLVLAALSVRRFRAVVWDGRVLLSVAVGALLFAPHAIWALGHRELALSGVKSLGVHESEPWLSMVLEGLGDMITAVAALLAPLLVVYAIWAWRARSAAAGPARFDEPAQLLFRQMLAALVGLVSVIFVFKVTGFKDRWFIPLFIGLPVLLVAAWGQRLGSERLQGLVLLAGAIAVAMLFLLPGHLWLGRDRKRPFRQNAPFRELAAAMQSLPTDAAFIIAENRWIGGNLRLCFPQHRVCVPELPAVAPNSRGKGWMIWNATAQESPPQALLNYVRGFAEIHQNRDAPRYVEAPYRHHRNKTMRLGILPVQAQQVDR